MRALCVEFIVFARKCTNAIGELVLGREVLVALHALIKRAAWFKSRTPEFASIA